ASTTDDTEGVVAAIEGAAVFDSAPVAALPEAPPAATGALVAPAPGRACEADDAVRSGATEADVGALPRGHSHHVAASAAMPMSATAATMAIADDCEGCD